MLQYHNYKSIAIEFFGFKFLYLLIIKSVTINDKVIKMEVVHLYTKIRKDFGKHCKFSAVPATILGEVPVSDKFAKDYIMRNPSISMFDTAAHMSEHNANTARLITKSSSMRHVEGGWPKDVDFTEQSDQNRFRKKAEKDDDYKASVKALGPIVAKCMKQNNTINIFEVLKLL